MVKEINYRDNARYTQQAAAAPKVKKASSKLYINSLEYNMIANLVAQQYNDGDTVKFEALLSIPLADRIPGLIEKYGKKTIHKLLVMILKEFCNTLVLTKAKKPTETKISVSACEFMLTSCEDYLSLEDIILFLQRARAGKYGIIKNLAHPSVLFDKLEQYRQARHEYYKKLKDSKDAELKMLGPVERIAAEPTAINDLFHQAHVIDMSTRKMSG